VHPAVQELVEHPVVCPADGIDLLRTKDRPRLTHILAFDTETTGIGHDARIVELAIARIDLATGEVTGTPRATLINPGCLIPRDATRVHGITDAMVRGAPDAGAVLRNALQLVVRSGLPMVAHNAAYDLARIRYEASLFNVALPGSIPVYCSLLSSRRLHRTVGHALPVIAQRYGVAAPDAHRALADVVTCGRILQHLLRRPDAASRDLRDCFSLEGML
jgi:DNA polymerase-3 subunit epsilon